MEKTFQRPQKPRFCFESKDSTATKTAFASYRHAALKPDRESQRFLDILNGLFDCILKVLKIRQSENISRRPISIINYSPPRRHVQYIDNNQELRVVQSSSILIDAICENPENDPCWYRLRILENDTQEEMRKFVKFTRKYRDLFTEYKIMELRTNLSSTSSIAQTCLACLRNNYDLHGYLNVEKEKVTKTLYLFIPYQAYKIIKSLTNNNWILRKRNLLHALQVWREWPHCFSLRLGTVIS